VRRLGGEDGVASLVPLLLWVVVLLTAVVLELGAHLVARAEAAALADATALAAVAGGEAPEAEARRVVAAAGGRLEACDCAAGAGRAEVEVSVAVPTMLARPLGAPRAHAGSSAVLVGRAPRVDPPP
jgi:hypothetical protein